MSSGALGNAPVVDFARMRRERRARLRDAMAANGFDAVVLIGPSNQEYAGIRQPPNDAMRMHHEPVVVIVTADGDAPFVWTGFPEGVPDDVPADQVHGPLLLEFPEGVEKLTRAIRAVAPNAARIAFDEMTSPMIGTLPGLFSGIELADATLATGAARILKTPDEIACLRYSQHINEVAMDDVEAALKPGVRQNELSAIFLRNVFESGAFSSIIDPIWSITPLSVAAGSLTANDDVGFPLASNDRFLREGDLILCDSGITWNGYHSDFGKTWICGIDPQPTAEQRACYTRWCEVIEAVYATIKPGASCGDLVRAAASVEPKHALRHFYLGHGCGCDSGEAPFIGSDLGLAFDDTVELAPGMVFVLEPVVWRDGVGGYRSEEIVVVTDDGFDKLTSYGYTPFA